MIRRSINVRVLIIAVVTLGVLGGGVLAAHRWQVARTASGLIVLADAQLKKGAAFKAAEYFDRYLRLRPDDSTTRVRLALVYGDAAYAEKSSDSNGRAI